MSRKRRTFDIDLPDELATVDPGTPKDARRGPMASAIAENAEALQARKSAAEAIRQENDALAHEYVALKEAGGVVLSVPLEEVHRTLLVRDRLPSDDEEDLVALMTSIKDIGLSNPIRVARRADGGFELVQGHRRLTAFERLNAAEPAGGWGEIPSLVVTEAASTSDLYRRMVDENIIRKDLSFAEMAHVAQVYADEPSTEAATLSDAIAELFQSAPYSKRSYIKSFAHLLDSVGDDLRWPNEIPRALGVALSRAIKARPELAADVSAELASVAPRSADEELAVLRGAVEGSGASSGPKPLVARKKRGAGATKTTFHIRSGAGPVKCTAAMGRLEIRVDRDFSAIERQRLEEAIATLVDGLA